MQYCSFQHWILLLSPVKSTTGCCFIFGSISSLFLELFLHWSPVAYRAPSDLGSSPFRVLSFCLFILFMKQHENIKQHAQEEQATSKEQQLRRHRRTERSCSTFKVRRGGHEEIPLIQGKELCCSLLGQPWREPHVQGKKNPSKMVGVARGHQRADRLKP